MIPTEIIDRIHELHAMEQESVELAHKAETPSELMAVDRRNEELDAELTDIERTVFKWCTQQPEFTDPNPQEPEWTPEAYHIAADILRQKAGFEPLLFFLADRWERFTWTDVVGY